MTNVDHCESHPEEAMKLNGEATGKIAKVSNYLHAFLVYVSTDYVFDGNKGQYTEDDRANPINIYGKSKLLGEWLVSKYSRDFAIVRPSVIFGASPSRGKENFALWVINKLKRLEMIKVVRDQFASPTLNSSLAEMVAEVCERHLEGTYHLSGATRIDRYSFALKLASAFNLNGGLILPSSSADINWIAKRPANSSLDVSKAMRLLKSKPIGIEDAIKRLKAELGGQSIC